MKINMADYEKLIIVGDDEDILEITKDNVGLTINALNDYKLKITKHKKGKVNLTEW